MRLGEFGSDLERAGRCGEAPRESTDGPHGSLWKYRNISSKGKVKESCNLNLQELGASAGSVSVIGTEDLSNHAFRSSGKLTRHRS